MRKIFFLIVAALLACTFKASAASDTPTDQPQQKREIVGFLPLPRGHWTYEAANRLSATGILEPSIAGRLKATTGVSRYEFAVWTVQVLGPQIEGSILKIDDFDKVVGQKVQADELTIRDSSGKERTVYKVELVDTLAAMACEFQGELQALSLKYLCEGRVRIIE